MDFKSISLKTTASKKILAVILSVLILLTAIPVGLVTSAKAASADDCMAVELGGKKVYFYGADTLEADETKDTVIHYTVSGQSDPSIYVDGKSEVDTTGVDVDTKEKTIDFGEWLGNQDKWVAVQLDDTKTVPSSEPVDVEVDKDAPVITISGNATAWTKDDVTLTVSAVDSKDGKDGVGVAAYNWGDGWSAVTTLKVSENKTYTVSVKDRVGNVAQESVVVDKIDKTAPKITNVKVDPDEWSNKVSYEVIAEDSESGVKSYKMDDGAWQDSNKFDVTDNKEHNFFAVDNAGNESESVAATATKYDNKKPVVNSVDVTYGGTSVSNDSYTTSNKKYEFTVDAKDDESGVKEYSIDSITWQDSSVFSLNGGATYSFYVKDNAGNVSEPFEVALKKDDDAPVISKIDPSTDQPTNSTITVKVEATDDVAGIKSYKIDDGDWQTSNTFEINDCQPHKFYVCDNAVPSNVSEATEFTAKNYCDVTPAVKSVDLSNDKDQKWTNQKITATVNADSVKNTYGTEFAIVGYKMDNGEWQTSNEFKDAIADKAEHKFYVKDSAGCVSEAYVVKSEKYDAKVPELAENVEFAQTNDNVFAEALNWLTFGKFFNKDLKVTVKVTDLADTSNNASGVDVDKLKFVFENATTSIEFSKDKFESVETENGVTTFVITVDKEELENFKGSAHIYITDNAGNETGDIPVTTANSNLGYVTDTDFNFMIENDAPVISNLKTQDDKTLYKEDFDITFGVNDQVEAKEYSGIAQVKITANGATVYDKKFNDSAVTPNADISYTFNAPSEVKIDKKECKVVFEIYVCDNSGNVTTESLTVIYDSSAPDIKNVSCVPGTEQWTNKTTKVVVDASDNYQLADNAYKMDGASNDETGWQKENTFEINDGKNHTLYVRDKAGNISSQSVNAKYDITVPVISSVTLNPDLKQWTNKAVTATVVADDKVGDSTKEVAASRVKSYKMGNGDWQASNQFKISDNEEHKFYAIDNAGNESVAVSATATNFDDIKPVISTVDVKYENTNINVSSDYTNSSKKYDFAVSGSDERSGIDSYGYSTSNDGQNITWLDKNSSDVSLNGGTTYYFYVKDNAGNVSEPFEVALKKDDDAPVISKIDPSTDQPTNSTITVKVEATDDVAGIKSYKIDDGDWQTSNTFEINDCQPHKFYVCDNAVPSNVSEATEFTAKNYCDVTPAVKSVDLSNDKDQKWTNQKITATVNADSVKNTYGTEFAIVGYKMDNGEWQTSNEFKDAIADKAEHKFYVKDSAGCVSEAYVVKSEKYDAKVPELAENVEFAQTNDNVFAEALNWLTFGKFFNKDLKVTVKVTDLADTSNNASGVDVDKLKFVFENATTSIEFSKDKFESVETENGVTTFVITANKDEIKNFKGTAYVSVTDNAGNKSDIAVTTENSNLATDENDKDFNFMIENDAPVIDGIDTTNNATIKKGYDFTFNVKDEQKDKNYSGIEQIKVTANDVPVYDKKYNDNAVTPNAGITLTVNGNNQTVNGVTINEWNNGDIVFKISARDNAGNKSEKTIKYDYDHTAPIISKFKISKNDAEQVTVDDYGFFFKSATTIKVYAEDNKKVVKKDEINEAFASGVASITVETLERDGTITVNTYEVANSDKIKQDNNGLYATVDIPAGFKGQIYALATDYTGNKSKDKDTGEDLYVHPDGTIVENGEQHGQNSAIEITNANKPVSQQSNTKKYSNSDKNVALDKEQSYDSTQNVPLYDKKAKFKVAVSDKVSGIKSVKYTLIEDGKESSDTLKIKTTKAADNNNKIKKAEIEKGDELLTVSTGNEDQSNKAKEEWTVSSKITDNDINIATKVESDIVVDANYNDIVLKVELTDNAGNKSYDYIIFGIDRTAPEITVAYKSSAKPETENYYSKTRSAYITIKERNITSEDVQLLIEKCTNMERNFSSSDKTEFRKGLNIEKNKIKNGSGNHDNRAYQIKVNFDKDGNYRIKTLKCVDTAKNANTAVKHVKYESSSNNDVVTAKNSTSFTIDKVKPVLKVSLDRNDQVHNKKYFNKTRTATITVTEHNFDTRDKADFVNNITASLNGKTINKPSVSSFKRQGGSDKWVATVKFDADGDYTLAFKVTDKAGNVFDVKKNTSGVFSGNAASDFTIDKTAPTISITNALANNRSYTTVPTIVLTEKDNNCSNITSSVEGTYYDDNTKSLKKLSLKANSNGVLTADHRTQNEVKYSVVEKDGIYTITVSCVDLAGNKSDTKTLRFTKNAEGSVFIPSADLSKLNNDYSNKAKLSKELYIDEYSANEIKNADYYININGKRVSENIISRKLVKDSSSANGGWYHYRYTIDNNAIRSEGEYSVYIKSSVTIDKSNTIHNNDSKNSKSHRIDINFTIDNTNPYVKITGLDRHTFIKTDKVPVKFYITDSNLSYVKVWVYDSNTKFDENTVPTYYWKASHKKDEANIKDWTEENGMVNVGFELPSSNNRMNVRFEIKDKADNICSDNRDFNKDQIFVTGVEEGQRAGSFEVVNGNVVLKDISINENLSFSAVASVIKDNIKLAVVIIVAIILVLAAIIILPIIIKRRKKLDAEDEKLLD